MSAAAINGLRSVAYGALDMAARIAAAHIKDASEMHAVLVQIARERAKIDGAR